MEQVQGDREFSVGYAQRHTMTLGSLSSGTVFLNRPLLATLTYGPIYMIRTMSFTYNLLFF